MPRQPCARNRGHLPYATVSLQPIWFLAPPPLFCLLLHASLLRPSRRFLEEIYRLHVANAFTTFSELATNLQTHRGIISEIESGRYHCNLKLLYLLHATYQVDILYVLTGQSDQPRPPVATRPVINAGRPARK
jgi:hypothetical protein